MMNNIKSNISNLTSLWKTATQPFNSYNEEGNLGYCFTPKSQWPNKIWLKNDNKEEYLEDVKLLLLAKIDKLTFSYFDKDINSQDNFFEVNGLKEISIQFGMSLNLSGKFKTQKNIQFKLVTNTIDSKIWAKYFHLAFGYTISEATINKTYQQLNYYLIYDGTNCIGTVLIHQTNKTIGIHSLGILPSMRGNGYATEIMHQVINFGIAQDCSLAVLQASKMAKSMYEKMGFTTEFIMRNYKLKNTITWN